MPPYVPDEGCFNAANAASDGKLTRDEINSAFQRAADYRSSLQAAGEVDRLGDKLRSFAEREGERTRIAAAMQRRHAALNVLVRDRLDQQIDGLMKAGLTPRNAVLAILEGSQRGVEGARNSVAALRWAYERRYAGGLFARMQADRPHLVKALSDPRLDGDIMREMSELREGGKPGITGNEDAKYVARVFAEYAELARTDLNRLGASIGKLEGWSGPQSHDDVKMIASGKEAWIAYIRPRLDIARTFADAEPSDIPGILGDVFDTLITGVPNRTSGREKGQRVNPANLARSLGKSRVLHFRDAAAALEYRERFGHGNTTSGIFGHLRRSAQLAANMQALGPNPEVMFDSVVAKLQRRVAHDPKLSEKARRDLSSELVSDAGILRNAMDIAAGLASRPVNVTAAKIGADVRAVQSMAKLGGSVITSILDLPVAASASMFRGGGYFKGLFAQLDGLRRGRPQGEVAEISYLLGEGFDGIQGHILAPAAATDGPVGHFAKGLHLFFKWNGQAWWTDVMRASAARTIAAEMGLRAGTDFNALPPQYRHVFGLHSIGETEWNAIRQAQFRVADGRVYVTPDRIADLPDATIEPLVAKRIAAARTTSRLDEAKTEPTRQKRQAEFDQRRQAILEDGRRDLQLSVLRFVADETSYGVLQADAASNRFVYRGQRPGTLTGEALRYIMQFKQFPTAFTQRVLGRAIYGQRRDATGFERTAHIGALVAGLALTGYMVGALKDMQKGWWPPRDPTDPKTWLAALLQSGAAGLYGDFLFSETNRYGGGMVDTLAGPTIGSVTDMIELGVEVVHKGVFTAYGEAERFPAARALNVAIGTTPGASLFYIRPALDYLVLNSMREAMSPGYLKRQEKRRRKDYGQRSYIDRRITETMR